MMDGLLSILKSRFEAHVSRHPGLNWTDVEKRLRSDPAKVKSLEAMEQTGGQPDVIEYDSRSGEIIFCDCAPESPKDRRSLCYDQAALEARKEHKPAGSAVSRAHDMGVELLDEQQYRDLQKLGEFDMKTSCWLKTPDEVRKLGGAIFGDRRYGRVFVYHNGAESYYAARGFRGLLRI